MSKVLLIIIDGLGDRPCKELSGKTPLEAAKKPNLDFLAKNGKLYLMNVINKKIAPESDQGVLSIFGYDVFKIYTGRGPLEAYGDDVRFKKGDVVVRCNFASLFNGKIHHNRVKDIEAMPTNEEVRLIEGLKVDNIRFKRTIGYRGVLIINKKISPRVTNSHPGYKVLRNFVTTALPIKNRLLIPRRVMPLEKSAEETAGIINRFIEQSGRLLKNKIILTRGAGNKLPKLKSMRDWVILADMPIERAIGKLANMVILDRPGSLKRLSNVIKKEIKKRNVYVQIKGPDHFAHRGDVIGKKRSIERIDKELIGKIRGLKDTKIIITADHSTACNLMAHSNDPVPVLVYGFGRNGTKTFSEKEAKKIGISVCGKELLNIAKKHTK